jgi:hypothetical protein
VSDRVFRYCKEMQAILKVELRGEKGYEILRVLFLEGQKVNVVDFEWVMELINESGWMDGEEFVERVKDRLKVEGCMVRGASRFSEYHDEHEDFMERLCDSEREIVVVLYMQRENGKREGYCEVNVEEEGSMERLVNHGICLSVLK